MHMQISSLTCTLHVCKCFSCVAGVSNKVQSNQLMLQERVPASFLKLQEKVGQLASQIRKSHRTPVLTEKVFR